MFIHDSIPAAGRAKQTRDENRRRQLPLFKQELWQVHMGLVSLSEPRSTPKTFIRTRHIFSSIVNRISPISHSLPCISSNHTPSLPYLHCHSSSPFRGWTSTQSSTIPVSISPGSRIYFATSRQSHWCHFRSESGPRGEIGNSEGRWALTAVNPLSLNMSASWKTPPIASLFAHGLG